MHLPQQQKRRGFTLLELLVVIAIIGVLATLAVVALTSSQQKGRDAYRVGAIQQLQTALELYNDVSTGYPATTGPVVIGVDGQKSLCTGGWKTTCDAGERIYISFAPAAPTPRDGACSDSDNDFTYNAPGGNEYTLTFCLGGPTGYLKAGKHTAVPGSIK